MQRRDAPVGYHAGAVPRWGASGDASVEDQLHVVGTSQVDFLPDDLLEQHPALHGPVEDLDQRELGLQYRDFVADACRRSVLRSSLGLRPMGSPPGHYTATIAWCDQRRRLRAAERSSGRGPSRHAPRGNTCLVGLRRSLARTGRGSWWLATSHVLRHRRVGRTALGVRGTRRPGRAGRRRYWPWKTESRRR